MVKFDVHGPSAVFRDEVFGQLTELKNVLAPLHFDLTLLLES